MPDTEPSKPSTPPSVHAMTVDELNTEASAHSGVTARYASDGIGAAWPLVDAMNAQGNPLRAFGFNVHSQGYVARFEPYDSASDPNPGTVIVRAYVKAQRARKARQA